MQSKMLIGNEEISGIILSICIPVYNWDIRPLIQRLRLELDSGSWGKSVEFYILDDFSSDFKVKSANAYFFFNSKADNLRYEELVKNIGRTKIRNLLAERTKGQYLLFMDSDVIPDQNTFINKYFEYALESKWDVVCGGCSYKTRKMIGEEYDFSHYLGKKTEAKPATIRNQKPWRYLFTSNVMIRRSCFLETHFDERFSGYGHEDTEWGIRLGKRYKVLHINNPVSHLGLVSKFSAYNKMRLSINNYVLLATLHPNAFRKNTIHRVMSLLALLNDSFLRGLDVFLERIFFRIQNVKICFLIFQFNKAVLFARQHKITNDYRSNP